MEFFTFSECKCGENSYGCDYVNGDKKCWCNSGYHVKDGICEGMLLIFS